MEKLPPNTQMSSSNIIIGLLLSFLALLLYNLRALLRFRRRLLFSRTLPGPSTLDLIRATKRGNLFDWLVSNRERYGGIYCFWVGLDLAVHVADPDLVRTVLSSTELTTKSVGYQMVEPWLGRGLLTNGGDDWHRKRKMLTPAFHFRILGSFKEPMDDCCDILVARLDRAAEDGRAVIDVYEFVTLFALDVICETAMGIRINAQNDQNSDFVRATKEVCAIFHSQMFSTWKRYPILFRFSDDNRRRAACLRILHGQTRRVIQKRRAQLDAEPLPTMPNMADDLAGDKYHDTDDGTTKRRRLAFLDLLLMAQRDGSPLTDANIREEVDTFMFEGHDTTSSAISFALYLLSRHADVQQKAFAETQQIGRMADANQSMPYLEAVIKETLRMYPSVPSYSRLTTQPFRLSEKITVPAGTNIAVQAYPLHRDAQLYPEPHRFRPERFLATDEVDGGGGRQHPYAHVAFSAGPRNCIGQRFAMLEMKCSLSRLIAEFEWLPAEGFEVQPVPELVLRSANGFQVRLRRR